MNPTLNFKTVGQGPPVIILHGLFGTLDNWLTTARKLEDEGFMTFLIDQRDHGRSDHTDAFNYTLLADDILRFMEENWIHETILIGHSMGGKTGLKFVSEHEDMVTKFIVIDICFRKYPSGHEDVFEALLKVDLNKIKSRKEVQDILMNKINNQGTVQFLMKNLTRKIEGGFEWKLNLSLLYKEYENILDEIKFDHPCETKTLFIRGSRSNYIRDEDIPVIQKTFPNSRIVTIEGAGHWVHVDKPNELFEEINAFIRE